MRAIEDSTKAWARSLGIPTEPLVPPVEGAGDGTPFTAEQVALRALAVQAVVAAACDVDSEAITRWLHDQGIWSHTTARERAFLEMRDRSEDLKRRVRWQQEAEWTLLWVVGLVDVLGLPTTTCDTRRLVDDILPPLGGEIGEYVAGAALRSSPELLAEDDRTYNLWCHAVKAQRAGTLPRDLQWAVLYQRRYAFEWLTGHEEWDEVQCDA